MSFISTIGLPTHTRGDTFRALDFTLSQTTLEGATGVTTPIDLTGATICLQVRPTKNSESVYLDLAEGAGITIVDPGHGSFQIDEQIIDIPVGTHYYDIEITLSTGFRFTWFIGTWTITSDITHG